MKHLKTFQKKKMLVTVLLFLAILVFLIGRLTWIMIFKSEFYGERAEDLQERENHQGGTRRDSGSQRCGSGRQ